MPGPHKPFALLIHGAWVNARCWEHLEPRLIDLGYTCVAPDWPHHPGDPEALGRLGIEEIVEHFARHARACEEPPLLIGHSFGGLVAQMLLDRGLGWGAVAVCSAPPRGVLPMHPWVLRTSLPMFTVWRGWERALNMQAADWSLGFTHTEPDDAQRAAYERYVMPESGRIWYQLGMSLVNGHAAVDFRASRAPLLLIGAGADRVTPPSVVRANHRRYVNGNAELAVLPGRPHFVLGATDCDDLADQIEAWVARNREGPGHEPSPLSHSAAATDQPPVEARAGHHVVIVGAGPAGLATAACLKQLGVESVLLDSGEEAGHSWRGHYHRLRLHTARALSGLPGLPIPRSFGPWVSAHDFATYLARYAVHHDLEVVPQTQVQRVRPVADGFELDTDRGVFTARCVVVATGLNRVPCIPEWPGVDTFTVSMVHSSSYGDGHPYANRDVLVVGVGNSGAEIAVDLVECGAGRVRLSVRTPPNILPRAILGLPVQATGVMFGWLPAALMDFLVKPIQWVTIGNLSRFGLQPAQRGLFTQVIRDRAIPLVDVGLVRLLREGRVQTVAAVDHLEGDSVILTDGERIRPEVVIAATGFRPQLASMLPEQLALDDHGLPALSEVAESTSQPGLYFAGFVVSVAGVLREIGIQAGRIATSIAAVPVATVPATSRAGTPTTATATIRADLP